MNARVFVEAIRNYVVNTAVIDGEESLVEPPGRQPSANAIAAAAWYQSLSELDREFLRHALSDVAEATAFGIMCVIDGVRVIEDTDDKSEFRLICVSPNGHEQLLNPFDGECLHDLFNATS